MAQMHNSLPVPMCAVCRRPVDELIQTKELGSGSVVLIARCHGSTETVVIPDNVLYVVNDRPHIEIGMAFAAKALA